jgi:histidine ammonia-lyase
VANLRRIIAVEITAAGRAIELRAPLEPAAGTGAAVAALRAADVPGAGPDRFLAPELGTVEELLRSGAILTAVTAATGELLA